MKPSEKPPGEESNRNELFVAGRRFFFKASLGADQIAREILKSSPEQKTEKKQ